MGSGCRRKLTAFKHTAETMKQRVAGAAWLRSSFHRESVKNRTCARKFRCKSGFLSSTKRINFQWCRLTLHLVEFGQFTSSLESATVAVVFEHESGDSPAASRLVICWARLVLSFRVPPMFVSKTAPTVSHALCRYAAFALQC